MSKDDKLVLYEHKESVCCHKVGLTFAEKQIKPDVVNVSLEHQEQRQPWYLAINPLGMVPALVHNGRTIVHSTIIIEYIDDTFPDPPLMPKESYLRAERRLWARRIDDGLHVPHIAAISFIIAFGQQFRARLDSPEKLADYFDNIKDVRYREMIRSWYESDLESASLRQSLQVYSAFLHDMEETLRRSAWLAGPDYSLADIDVVPYLWRLSNLQLDFLWAKLPRVTDWFERLTARPAFKSAIIDTGLPDWIGGMREAGLKARPRLERVVADLDVRVA